MPEVSPRYIRPDKFHIAATSQAVEEGLNEAVISFSTR